MANDYSETFTVAGSYGVLTVCSKTGKVLSYQPAEEDDREYDYIDRFDIAEYVEYDGGLEDTDILLIGYWTKTGEYEPPCFQERDMRGPEITIRHRMKQAEVN